MNTSTTASKPTARQNNLFLLFCVCGFVFVLSLIILILRPGEEQNDLDIDGKRAELRLIADAERLAWEEEISKQANDYNDRLQTNSIAELSKLAVDTLSRAANPEYIIYSAIEEAKKTLGKPVTRPPWVKITDPKNNRFWAIVHRNAGDKYNDWWIERNTVFGQYRLVGQSNQRIYFSIKKEAKLRSVLSNIIVFGRHQSRPFIQVVADENAVVNDECKKLLLEKAQKIFPETVNLSAIFYTIHPLNRYALIPVENFLANLALDKDNECIVLLGKMGAKSVHISRSSSEATGGSASGESSGMTHKVAVGGSLFKELSSEMDFIVEFSGDSHIVPPPDLLQNSIWHKDDPQLSAIMASRSGNHRIQKLDYSEKEMSNFNFDIKAAARVLGISEVAIQAEFQKEKERTRKFEVSF